MFNKSMLTSNINEKEASTKNERKPRTFKIRVFFQRSVSLRAMEIRLDESYLKYLALGPVRATQLCQMTEKRGDKRGPKWLIFRAFWPFLLK